MKKLLSILSLSFLALTVTACGETGGPAASAAGDGIQIGMIPSFGGVDDGSFSQGAWEAITAFGAANNMAGNYFIPAEFTDAGQMSAIELARAAGSEIIFAPGFTFEAAVYQAQALFPELSFVLIDAVPSPPGGDSYIASNTVAITYAEEEAGFLAGYAIVMEGHRSLGFIGGMPIPPVSRFGHGFVTGAEYAARSLGLAPGEVTVMYNYVMTFGPDPHVQTTAAAWFNSGVEVIFSAAGGAGGAVMAAAEAQGGLVIGVDIDQSDDSDTVIVSAIKGVNTSVYAMLEDFVAGQFPGGQHLVFGAANHGIGLTMETARFQNFTQAQYEAIFERLANGEIVVIVDLAAGIDAIDLQIVDITII